MPNIEHLTFVECTTILVNEIAQDPLQVAQKCLEENLVSQNLIWSIQTQGKDDRAKASELVTVLITKVEHFPEKFRVFMRILHELRYLKDVSTKVEAKYEEKQRNAMDQACGSLN